MAIKSKVLIIGGTGYIGKRIVRASLAQGHETFILQRAELVTTDIDKLQMLVAFKKQGARLIEASFNDHASLVSALKLVDVVICAIAGTSFRGFHIMEQLKLIEAIKEAGNIKRFLPSEFGMDVGRIGHAILAGRETVDDKMVIRKAIQDAEIPYTFISANLFAGYFIPNLGDLLHTLTAPKEKVYMYGDGNVKAVFTDEEDIGTYVIKTVDDPRALNKTIYIRPPQNVLCQSEIVDMYEKLTGKTMERIHVSEEDFIAAMEGMDYHHQTGVRHFYHFFYEGCLANFEVSDDVEASRLYPEVQPTHMEDYMKQYI